VAVDLAHLLLFMMVVTAVLEEGVEVKTRHHFQQELLALATRHLHRHLKVTTVAQT
jgi:hypothetical protein